jgi:hypothetical protein
VINSVRVGLYALGGLALMATQASAQGAGISMPGAIGGGLAVVGAGIGNLSKLVRFESP